MTDKQTEGFGYFSFGERIIIPVIIFAGITSAITYEKEKKDYNLAPRGAICDLAVEPLRQSFVQNCNLENFGNGSVLIDIAKERDQISQKLGCAESEWQCEPNVQYDLSRGFKVKYRYK